ncbi:MAG TPA: V-type ATP synthase subunit D, partial [Micromonosporaceae bacterium]
MPDLRRVPPGRAGRLWLMARLHAGRLAVDLLDRKLRILRLEQERFRLRASQTGREWQTSWRTADRWGARAAVLGGRRELRLAAPAAATDVKVTWASVMGVRYPAEASCRLPAVSDADRSPGTAAL